MTRCPFVLAALLLGLAAPLAAQAPRIVAAVEPDSVHVGETFTVGLTVTGSPGEVEFPATLPVEDPLEQRGPVQIRSIDGGAEWRAYYTVVSWRADTVAIPAIEVSTTATGSATLTATPPALIVHSVLPSDVAEFELREAKPFLRVRAFPWWVLLLLGAVAAGIWWWMRARAEPAPAFGPRGPAAVALREFDRLRGDWLQGRVTGDGFFDRFEGALRRYARSTRGWPAARSIFGLGRDDPGLLTALRRSLVVRFARVRAEDEIPLSALDAGERFVRSEMPQHPDLGAPEAESRERLDAETREEGAA